MKYTELEDTIALMKSDDYKERFRAEYHQLKIRMGALESMLVKFEAGTLGFEPTCPKEVLEDQLYFMREYLRVLKIRAEIESIHLED